MKGTLLVIAKIDWIMKDYSFFNKIMCFLFNINSLIVQLLNFKKFNGNNYAD